MILLLVSVSYFPAEVKVRSVISKKGTNIKFLDFHLETLILMVIFKFISDFLDFIL